MHSSGMRTARSLTIWGVRRAWLGGGMRGRGNTCQGACVAGGMHGRGCAWQGGMCVVGGMCGGGMHGREGMHGTHALAPHGQNDRRM